VHFLSIFPAYKEATELAGLGGEESSSVKVLPVLEERKYLHM
jgi:hypothetical protein